MRRFGASNARRCARPGEVIAPMVIATTRSAIPKRHQAYVALCAPITFRANSAASEARQRRAHALRWSRSSSSIDPLERQRERARACASGQHACASSRVAGAALCPKRRRRSGIEGVGKCSRPLCHKAKRSFITPKHFYKPPYALIEYLLQSNYRLFSVPLVTDLVTFDEELKEFRNLRRQACGR
jgi:hypothetical protein